MLDVNLVELLTLATSLVAANRRAGGEREAGQAGRQGGDPGGGPPRARQRARPSQLDGDRGAGRPPPVEDSSVGR